MSGVLRDLTSSGCSERRRYSEIARSWLDKVSGAMDCLTAQVLKRVVIIQGRSVSQKILSRPGLNV